MAQIVACEMNNAAGMIPVLKNSGHDGEEHVMRSVGRGENLRRPMRDVCATELGGDFDVCCTDVIPRRTVVRGFSDADLRAVNPRDTGLVGRGGAAVRVEHPPTFHARIPDDDRIRRAIVNWIAEEWFRRRRPGFSGGTPCADEQRNADQENIFRHGRAG